MTKTMLFEIGVEEIPARFMAGSLQSLAAAAEKALTEARLSFQSVKALGTPRRLALSVAGLAEGQEDLISEVKGPALKASYDADGQPTKALLGFARAQGMDPAQLFTKQVGKAAYVFANREEKGRPAGEVLPEILRGLVQSLRFPKPMRWGDHDMRFVRPIRWLVALLDEDVIPLRIVNIESGRLSRSHRFYGAGEVVIDHAAHYRDLLRDNYVIVDVDERRTMIWEQITALARGRDAVVERDEDLLEEVVFLLEYPTALLGNFEERYLQLPREVVITPMREHQHYFPVQDRQGNLLPHFVTVRNGLARHLDIVTAGNEKVLRARLVDAEFYWQEDLKKPLADNISRLQGIVFHVALGTMLDKVERLQALAAYLAAQCGVEEGDVSRGAYLAKADLLSNMVYDFPELQGIMGAYYARAQGEKACVAQSIREHYLPRFAGDDLPASPQGMILSLADKLDSVVGFFSMGQEPSGSQDPYALRRQAMGIVQILLASHWTLSLSDLIDQAYQQIAARFTPTLDFGTTKTKVLAFFKQRLANVLAEKGLAYDTIAAVIGEAPADVCRVERLGLALDNFRRGEHFATLMAGFTRANNLAKDGPPRFDERSFSEAVERDLVSSYRQCREQTAAALAADDFVAAFTALAALREPIDRYLTDVMVMCEDETLRHNRLGLLKSIVDLMLSVADFRKIVLENKGAAS